MISIDSRIGSGELAGRFRPYGIEVNVTKLDFGDFEFEGNGPKGKCAIVFERKRIEDLIDSMESNRLTGHQLPGMADRYDYAYLLIEGIWRPNRDGVLEIGNHGWQTKRITVRAIVNFVMGLAFRAGVVPWRTGSPDETVSFIVDQYRMWNDKLWGEHKSHESVYAPAEAGLGFGLNLIKRKVSRTEKVAMQLPGLDDKARYVADHFKTIRNMANADVAEWQDVPWKTRGGKPRTIGQISAKKIVQAITTQQ